MTNLTYYDGVSSCHETKAEKYGTWDNKLIKKLNTYPQIMHKKSTATTVTQTQSWSLFTWFACIIHNIFVDHVIVLDDDADK